MKCPKHADMPMLFVSSKNQYRCAAKGCRVTRKWEPLHGLRHEVDYTVVAKASPVFVIARDPSGNLRFYITFEEGDKHCAVEVTNTINVPDAGSAMSRVEERMEGRGAHHTRESLLVAQQARLGHVQIVANSGREPALKKERDRLT
jgi:hypothetical protein